MPCDEARKTFEKCSEDFESLKKTRNLLTYPVPLIKILILAELLLRKLLSIVPKMPRRERKLRILPVHFVALEPTLT